jgi:hypothetical protein
MNSELRPIRTDRVLRHLDVSHGRGLEIGPLNDPFVHRSEADVRYVDVHPAELLRRNYADHTGFDAESIVEVDHWLISDEGHVRSLAEATAASAPFEWAVASHVIEHVPDLLAWLGDVAEVLVDGGLLSLVIPDRRYTFDVIRAPTSLGQVLQASHDRDVRPSVRAVFDSTHYARRVPPKDQWHADAVRTAPPVHPPLYVAEQLERARAGREYLDAHVWVWTPEELVGQLATLAEMGLIEFAIESVIPTPDNEIEFYVTLRRLARELSPQQREAELHDSYSAALDALAVSELEWPDERPEKERGVPGFLVSPAERRVILAKRGLFKSLYAATHWVLGRRKER